MTFGHCLSVNVYNAVIGLILYIKNVYQIDEFIIPENIDVQLICIDKKFRGRGLFNVMVKELTARYNIIGKKTGTFCSNIYIPKPIIKTKCYHKLLNMTRDIKKFYGLRTDPSYDKIEIIEKEKLNKEYQVKKSNEKYYEAYNEYMNKFNLHPNYDMEMFYKIFNNTYVIYDENNTYDYFSIMTYNKKINNETIKVGRVINYTCNNLTAYILMKIIINTLIDEKYDIIEMFNMLENDIFFVDFAMTISNINYYMYLFNWSHLEMCPNMFYKLII
jgi:glycylpeptide N-tetradecanoyltransferase